MNLLIDQSDQQQQQHSAEPQETPESKIQTFEDEGMAALQADTPKDYYRYDRAYKKKRNVLGPVLIIVVLLAIIMTAAYFSFFYKSNEFTSYTPSTKNKPWQKDSIATKTIIPPTVSKTDSGKIKSLSNTIEKTIPPANKIAVNKPVAMTTTILSIITSSFPEDMNIGTVIIDENSFSIEVSSSSRSAIESYFAGLKKQVNGDLSFSPSSGNYSGVRALITGTFQSSKQEWRSDTKASNIDDLLKNIRQKAVDSGLKVVEITSEKSKTLSGLKRTPLFIKVTGDGNSFSTFSSSIVNITQNIGVSKLIVMFSSRQNVTYVLRLDYVQP